MSNINYGIIVAVSDNNVIGKNGKSIYLVLLWLFHTNHVKVVPDLLLHLV